MHRRVTGALAAVAVLIAPLLTGCGFLPGTTNRCDQTSIGVEDVSAETGEEPLALTALLTADGQPVAGAEVAFYIFRSRDGVLQAGTYSGSGTTDADGVAELRFEGGSQDILSASAEKVESYSAEYVAEGEVGGVRYCGSTSDRAVIDVPCAGFGCRW